MLETWSASTWYRSIFLILVLMVVTMAMILSVASVVSSPVSVTEISIDDIDIRRRSELPESKHLADNTTELKRADTSINSLIIEVQTHNSVDNRTLLNTLRQNTLINTLPPSLERPKESKSFPMSTKEPILFAHFHKSGGTSVCLAMVRRSHVAMSNMAAYRNCNAPFSGPKKKVTKYQKFQTCSQLSRLVVDSNGQRIPGNDFLGIEVPYADELPCPGFRSFALMREPVERLLSHMRFHKWNETILREWIMYKKPHSRDKYIDGYPIVNSMVTRQLLGQKRYSDTRPVDETDFERAKVLMARFNAFVPLEYLQNEYVGQVLHAAVPEYYEALTKRNIVANAHSKQNDTDDQPLASKGFIELITAENKFDILLYQHMLNTLSLT